MCGEKIIIDYLFFISYHKLTIRQRKVVKTRNGSLTNLDTESEVICDERFSQRSSKKTPQDNLLHSLLCFDGVAIKIKKSSPTY